MMSLLIGKWMFTILQLTCFMAWSESIMNEAFKSIEYYGNQIIGDHLNSMSFMIHSSNSASQIIKYIQHESVSKVYFKCMKNQHASYSVRRTKTMTLIVNPTFVVK